MAAYPAHGISALMEVCWAVQGVLQLQSMGWLCHYILYQML